MKLNTKKLVKAVKQTEQDFEWYPTTDEIINTIKKDYDEEGYENPSVLDCGAGDGRVLQKLTKGGKYAIEKSEPLLVALDRSIFVVGTEFKEQTLLDKKVDVLFCNPPYSEYEEWVTKIIKETHAPYVYLVIPDRWVKSEGIKSSIELRKGKTEILGSFDFNNADRKARAKVNIVKVLLGHSRHGHSRGQSRTNPFDIWFEEYFKLDIANTETSKYQFQTESKANIHDKVTTELVNSTGLVSALEEFYQKDLGNLINTYRKLCDVDPEILEQLDVNIEGVREALRFKIENLKDVYWGELFDNLTTVTEKLTATSRSQLLDTLTAHTHVDFTQSNAHAVVLWVIKNANTYLDDQLITMVNKLTEKANVLSYKSNKKTFGDEDWRYCRKPELDHYRLDYRIVLEHVGGLHRGFGNGVNGLSDSGATLLNDLCTIANNLNYNTAHMHRVGSFTWGDKGSKVFEYLDTDGKTRTLMAVRAYKNGNMHIKFSSKFIMRLNVEFGRLKGWLKDAQQASDELDIPLEEAAASFNSHCKIGGSTLLKLGFSEES